MKSVYKFIAIALYFLLPSAYAINPLLIGTVEFDPPYVFSMSQGFEIDLMQQICKGLKTTCTFIPMDYNQLFIQLNEQKIDLAIDGLDFYIHNNYLNGPYIYSLPYLLSQGQFIVLKKNPVTKITELPAKTKIGVIREHSARGSGVFFQFLEKKYANQYTWVQYTALEELIDALHDGEIVAAFLDNNEANYWVLNSKGAFKALGNPMSVADGIGIAALPEDRALINQVNQQLQKILISPAYIQLYNTYINTLPSKDS